MNIPLSVSDYAGIDRIDEPLTSGVPISESENIMLTTDLEVVDIYNNFVPTQFTVLSRWHGVPEDETKTIKWVLLDFNANVTADGESVYYLRNATAPSTIETNLSIQEDDNQIVVNTGVNEFIINKNYFNLFDYVTSDGNEIVAQPNDGGVVLTGADGTVYYTTLEAPEEIEIEENGPMRSVVKIRGVFKAEDGSYFAPSVHFPKEKPKFDQPYEKSFFYYSCRIHFYNDKDYVKVFLTLENNGSNGRTNPEGRYAPIQIVYFDSVNLIVNSPTNNQTNIISEDSSTQLNTSDDFTLYQNWKENLTDGDVTTLEPVFENGIFYNTNKNNTELTIGLTNPGWIDSNDNLRGIGLNIRHFWQNFPKKITINSSKIKIGLWPEEGYYPYLKQSDFPDPKYDIYVKEGGRDAGVYLFEAGRHKTHEMFLRFYPGFQDSITQILSKSLESPLMALAPSEWYVETKALGLIGSIDLKFSDPKINEAMKRYERLQTAMVYEEDSDNVWTIQVIKTYNPPHHQWAAQNKFFGWMNFGDLIWATTKVYSSLHYDWTQKMLLHYIRSGKRKLFDAGVEMAKHRYDVDQYWGERSATDGHHLWLNHFQFYEMDGHGELRSKVSQPMHNWNNGIILYYLLTGDKKSLEAAEDNTKGILNHFGEFGLYNATKQGCVREVRAEGWSMSNLISLYRVTGNLLYLKTARNIAINRYLFTEQESGGRGNLGGVQSSNILNNIFNIVSTECAEIGDICKRCKNSSDPMMMGYVEEGLIAVHQETQDEELKDLLIRITNFFKDKMVFGGDYDENGNYRHLRVCKLWIEEDPYGEIRKVSDYNNNEHWGFDEPTYILPFTDYLAYTYQLTGDSAYLDLARKCFRDMMFYYTIYDSYHDSELRSKISFVDGMFAGTHTKMHGWLGRFGQVYLNAEYQLQQGELKIITDSVPNGIVNQKYGYSISIGGGISPFTWYINQEELPNGIILTNDGILIGTPASEGIYEFTVQITDSSDVLQTATKQLSLTIGAQEINGDVNNDGVLDINDYSSLRDAIGKFTDETGFISELDYDNNGYISYSDFKVWYSHFKNR